MKTFDAFRTAFGAPVTGSGRPPAALGLENAGGLADFVARVGAGRFRHGLLSVCSEREGDGGLGEWSDYLPAACRLFATGAFGFLFATRGEEVWVIDPHHGQVVESNIPLGELFDTLAEPGLREEFLKESLFADWLELGGEEPVEHILCPTPVPALGGNWSLASLRPMSLPVFLSFTAQLFDQQGKHRVEVRRL
jgi:hypothetical protein